MAGIVFACVAPHGIALIPELSANADGGLATRAAMQELGRRCVAAKPDVLVVVTPHGMRVDGAMCLAAVGRAAGTIRWAGRQVELNVPVDMALTDSIAAAASAAQIPVALAGFGGNQREHSVMPLDWGTAVPIWFLGHNHNHIGHGDVLAEAPASRTGPPLVIVSPSRSLPRTSLVEFGRVIARAAAADGRRAAFIASCDWAHTHSAAGPYGFSPAAAKVDRVVLDAFNEGAPGNLIDLPAEQVQAAAIDGLWQTLVLAGVLAETQLGGEVLSYEAPTYFGMLVASFQPA